MPTTLPARRNAVATPDFDDLAVSFLIGLTLALALAALLTVVEIPIAFDPGLFDGPSLSLP
jgi:hypothetical protein